MYNDSSDKCLLNGIVIEVRVMSAPAVFSDIEVITVRISNKREKRMIKMIPTPKKYDVSEEKCFWLCHIFTAEEDWQRGCEIFTEAGSYVIDAEDTIKAYAVDDEGVLYALASLLQLMNARMVGWVSINYILKTMRKKATVL